METINVPMNGGFDAKTIELADKFQSAEPGTQFRLCLFDSGTISVDSVLAFHEIARLRPKGISLHIHSHNCLVCAEVLIWLAGDTRTLRSDAWIHFLEYPRNRLARSDYQQFRDSLEGYEMPLGLTPFQENYLQIERLVKKHLPVHLLNRRVWSGELAEWNIIKPAVIVVKPESADTINEKKDAELGSILPSEFAAEKPFRKR
jgi:hypothetical protein